MKEELFQLFKNFWDGQEHTEVDAWMHVYTYLKNNDAPLLDVLSVKHKINTLLAKKEPSSWMVNTEGLLKHRTGGFDY